MKWAYVIFDPNRPRNNMFTLKKGSGCNLSELEYIINFLVEFAGYRQPSNDSEYNLKSKFQILSIILNFCPLNNNQLEIVCHLYGLLYSTVKS